MTNIGSLYIPFMTHLQWLLYEWIRSHKEKDMHCNGWGCYHSSVSVKTRKHTHTHSDVSDGIFLFKDHKFYIVLIYKLYDVAH